MLYSKSYCPDHRLDRGYLVLREKLSSRKFGTESPSNGYIRFPNQGPLRGIEHRNRLFA